MKRAIVFIILILNIALSCKSYQSKTQLVSENKALKERIKTLEAYDSLNIEAALELKNINVVYRGVSNPIYISKPNVLSFEASAPGLIKKDSLGNYMLSPRSGKSVDIEIKSKLKNGDSITEIKTLRIKEIKKLQSLFNGLKRNQSVRKLTKEELVNGKITLTVEDFLFDLGLIVKSYKIKFPNEETMQIEGNIIPNNLNQYIKNLEENDSVVIFDISRKTQNNKFSNIRICKIPPITIEIKK